MDMILNKKFWGSALLVEVFTIVFLVGFLPISWHFMVYGVLHTLLFVTSILNLKKANNSMLGLASIVLILEWVSILAGLPILAGITRVFDVFFFGIIVASLIKQIAAAKTVSKTEILGAVNGYLLLGILFATLVRLVVQIDPLAFSFDYAADSPFTSNIYYAFVTMTTLGYGDLVPLKAHSKTLAMLIAVCGQLYLTILIALLVGKYAGQSEKQ